MTRSALSNQIANRNFLAPVGFKFTLSKFPKVSFFSNTARIPDITLGTAIQSNYLKDIDVPGDKLTYGELNVRFLVDENLENYMAMHNWLTGLGFPALYSTFIIETRGYPPGTHLSGVSFKLLIVLIIPVNPFSIRIAAFTPKA